MLSFGMEQNVLLVERLFLFFFKLRLTLDEAENKLYRTQEGAMWTETEMKSFHCFMLFIGLLIK